MNVKLKERILKDGSKSLYLEYYLGYETDKSGKIKHNRKKENLDLYILSKPVNAFQRAENKKALALAKKILTKREAEVNENKFEAYFGTKADVNLLNYFEKIKDSKNSSNSLRKYWGNTIKHLRNYCDTDTITFKSVNEAFVSGFREYLLRKSGLHNNTASGYFEIFRGGLKKAVKEGVLKELPFGNITGIKKTDPQRDYLTLEEVNKLALTECDCPTLKKAFLFACMAGLRWCDINAMKWGDIKQDGKHYKLTFRQQKTKSVEYLPLSEQAVEILGKFENSEEKVFGNLSYTTYGYYKLQKWGIKAGIEKDITFHIARHTFATLLLNNGTDIYTVSKLLGHKSLQTTQIYAKIVDATKIDAVNNLPKIII